MENMFFGAESARMRDDSIRYIPDGFLTRPGSKRVRTALQRAMGSLDFPSIDSIPNSLPYPACSFELNDMVGKQSNKKITLRRQSSH